MAKEELNVCFWQHFGCLAYVKSYDNGYAVIYQVRNSNEDQVHAHDPATLFYHQCLYPEKRGITYRRTNDTLTNESLHWCYSIVS